MLSWIAGGIELLAIWVVGNKNKWGFVIHLVGGSLWTYIGITNPEVRGLLVVTLPALVINIRNFIKWKKTECIK